MAFDLVVRNAREIITASGGPGDPLAPIASGALGVTHGAVSFLGPEATLPQGAVGADTEVLDARGGFVGPGFVDAHTHAVFAGNRAAEFDARCQGKTYQALAAQGGGILSTVRATRAASEDELVALALPRLARLLACGVTTAEVKSGYGLNVPDELKMLRAIARLGQEQPIALIPTLLCAHAIPEEHRADRAAYVRLCTDAIIPAAKGLARFCDAFVEDGAFEAAEARRILEAGLENGLVPKVHADQLSPCGGARLAAELSAASADHLEQVSDDDIAALARAGTAALLVPTSTLVLRQPRYAPGRRLKEAGVPLALGTNLNPGSAMSESVPLMLGLACLGNGLSAAEAYWAATRGAALALREERAGRLAVGAPADFVLFSCASYEHLPYHLGVNHAAAVVKGGRVVCRSDLAFCP